MKKSYSHFSVEDIRALKLQIINQRLFPSVTAIPPSQWLLDLLDSYEGVPLQSEKAKSEVLISPLINEIRLKNPKKFTFFSGYQFNVDVKQGLKGFCDFLISKKYNATFVESPIVAVVEAKHNQDLLDAAPQCIAEMYAARLFNQHAQEEIEAIYGAVTNGYEWMFLKLQQQQVITDIDRYGLSNLPQLLGAWQCIVDEF
jgi:hypothetical protein